MTEELDIYRIIWPEHQIRAERFAQELEETKKVYADLTVGISVILMGQEELSFPMTNVGIIVMGDSKEMIDSFHEKAKALAKKQGGRCSDITEETFQPEGQESFLMSLRTFSFTELSF